MGGINITYALTKGPFTGAYRYFRTSEILDTSGAIDMGIPGSFISDSLYAAPVSVQGGFSRAYPVENVKIGDTTGTTPGITLLNRIDSTGYYINRLYQSATDLGVAMYVAAYRYGTEKYSFANLYPIRMLNNTPNMRTALIFDGNTIKVIFTEYRHLYRVSTNSYVVGLSSDLSERIIATGASEATYLGEYYIIPNSPTYNNFTFYSTDSPPDVANLTLSPLLPVVEKGEETSFKVTVDPVESYPLIKWEVTNGAIITNSPDSYVDDSGEFVSFLRVTTPEDFNNNSYSVTATARNRSISTTAYIGQNSGPYEPGGSSGPAGGGGNFGNDRTSDDIVGTIPSGSAANSLADAGIFSHYLMTGSQLKTFGDWLWADNIIETLNKELIELWFGNIYEAIISLTSYPFAIGQLRGVTTSPDVVYLGGYNTATASSGRLLTDVAQIDWGSVTISEYWGNFLDYAPHTKIQLYLPWGTGFVDIDPNEVMNGTLHVITNIELSKGTCVHHVCTGTGSVIGTYSGFCGAQYPITSKDTSGKAISAAIGAVSTAVSVASSAIGRGAGESAYISGANQPVPANVRNRAAHQRKMGEEARDNAMRPYQSLSTRTAKTAAVSSLAAARTPIHFNRNGSFAPNGSALAIQYPYIIMTWPDQSVPEQYGSHVGYPSNIYISLGRLRGYSEVGAIHLEGINCTEHEREELTSLLQGGVIL